MQGQGLSVGSYDYPTVERAQVSVQLAEPAWRALSLPQRQVQLIDDKYLELTSRVVQQVQVPDLLAKRIKSTLQDVITEEAHMSYTGKIEMLRAGRETWLKSGIESTAAKIWAKQVGQAFPYPAEIRQELKSLVKSRLDENKSIHELMSAFKADMDMDTLQVLSRIPEQPHGSTEAYPLISVDFRGDMADWAAYACAATWADTSLPSFWTGFRITPEGTLFGPTLPRQVGAINLVRGSTPDPAWSLNDSAIAQTQLSVGAWLVNDAESTYDYRRDLKNATLWARRRTHGPGILAVLKNQREIISPVATLTTEQFNYDSMKPVWLREHVSRDFPFFTTQLGKLESGRSFFETIRLAQGYEYSNIASSPHFFLMQRLFPTSLKSEVDWELLTNHPEEFVAGHLTKVILADLQAELNAQPLKRQWVYQIQFYIYY
jgi:hypothetical protein